MGHKDQELKIEMSKFVETSRVLNTSVHDVQNIAPRMTVTCVNHRPDAFMRLAYKFIITSSTESLVPCRFRSVAFPT